jgi:SAM-dependent methyltransferase
MESTKYIYNMIAEEFDLYRVKVWPCVTRFLENFNSDHLLLDIGCGNGKNIIGNSHLKFKGIDFSDKLVDICKSKGLDVIEASMTNIPFNDCMFDGFIAVASYHHLNNDLDRMCALNSMYRVLRPGGRGLIVVWAEERDMLTKFNFIRDPSKVTSLYGFDEMVLWKSKSGVEYNRYYHIYGKNDLAEEVKTYEPRFTIEKIGWERGNWFVIVKK